ncbi:hypothetical protein DV738_g531, partial [Chaetothyriales sp. CBS 135597]
MSEVKVKAYRLAPTKLIPNSPHPLLHYPGFFDIDADHVTPVDVHDLFSRNGWQTQWIFRYGDTQRSHYHSETHECMVVLTGNASIRFGVADTDPDLQLNTYGPAREDGGVEIAARPGDVFVIPAGVAHKTYAALPATPFKLLTPGSGHSVEASDVREALREIVPSGFSMIGAYPQEGGVWDFAEGGEHAGHFEQVWSVPKPKYDPVMGSDGGLVTLWKTEDKV